MPVWARYLPWNLITTVSDKTGIDPKLMASIIWMESGGDNWASRYEPNWHWFLNVDEWAKKTKVTSETERMHQATSWGLMQVMGTVAREMGWNDHLPKLCSKQVNLEIGCQKFKSLVDRFGTTEKAIAAYNAGSPKMTATGFKNQGYVDGVLQLFRSL